MEGGMKVKSRVETGIRVGVTGMPRAGTSLMMRIVGKLGCTIYGQKSVPHFSLKHNPGGYWELHDYEVAKTRFEWNEDDNDRVVKVFPMLIRQFPVDKYIVMARDIHDAAKSFQKVLTDAGSMDWCGTHKEFDGTYGEALYGVNANFSSAMHYVNKHKHSYIMVDFEELKKEPKKMIEKIAKYLEIGSTAKDIEDAAALVRR